MNNPLFNLLGGAEPPMPDFIKRFNQFKSTFSGDPRQQVQQLLNSGRMSQDQFNRLAQMANQIQKSLRP